MKFRTVGPKAEKDLFSKVSREKRGPVSRCVKRAESPRGIAWTKKVRNIWYYTVLTDTLIEEPSNFVLNPRIH